MCYKIKGLLIVVVLVSFGMSNSFADVKVIPEAGNSKAIIIENETIRMVIDPDCGGRVVSFVHRPAGKEVIVRDQPYMGLFADHMWNQGFPGELMEVPYEMEIVKGGPDEVRVKLWRKMTGEWMGNIKKTLQGLIIEKTFTVKAGVDGIFCHIALKNSTNEGRLSDYWLQNVFYIGGDYDATADVFYRPSCRGVKASFKGTIQGDYLKDPYAGWSSALDREKGHGLVWLMDYNYLDMLYNSGWNQTLEWMYDKTPIPPGKAWETDIVMVPIINMDNISHASKYLIGGIEIEREGNDITLKHQLRTGVEPVKDLKLKVEILSITDKKKLSLSPLSIDDLTTEVKTFSQSIEFNAGNPLIVTIFANGKSDGYEFQEKYFVFYSGGFGFGGENLQPDTVTPLYKVERPEKNQVLMKPEKIERKYGEKPVVFLIQGLLAENYGIDEALRLLEADSTSGHGFYNQTGYAGSNLSFFPYDYETLMRHDVIIVANANVQCLGKLGLEMLRDYVTHGGSLLFLGGKASYGAGGLNGSGLEDILPVQVDDNLFDIEYIMNAPVIMEKSHPITKGLEIPTSKKVAQKDNPVCHYLHQIKVKKGADVLLSAGDKPLLVVSEVEGGGQIACFLGTPYGPSDEKGLVFTLDKWPQLLENILTWLSNPGQLN